MIDRPEQQNGDGREKDEDTFRLAPDDTPPPVPARSIEAAPAARILAPAIDVDVVGGEPEIDDRTLAEKQGKERASALDVLPKPDGWPGESLVFPFRKPGPALLGALTVVMILLDVLGAFEGVRFLSWLFKVLAYAFVLGTQLAVISSSASGDDVPRVSNRASEKTDASSMRRYGFFIGCCVIPLIAFAYLMQRFDWMLWSGLAAVVFLCLYQSAWALGAALNDHRIKYPWHAIPMIFKAPLTCIVGALGLVGCLVAEWVHLSVNGNGLGQVLAASIPLRFVAAYLLVFSARWLGVLGRSWAAGTMAAGYGEA